MALCTWRPPRQMDDGAAPVSMPSVPTYFRMMYNEFLDNAMQTIKSRMDQSALKFYCAVEDAVLSTAN
jgi:hypothetical protein